MIYEPLFSEVQSSIILQRIDALARVAVDARTQAEYVELNRLRWAIETLARCALGKPQREKPDVIGLIGLDEKPKSEAATEKSWAVEHKGNWR